MLGRTRERPIRFVVLAALLALGGLQIARGVIAMPI
jgi:hypothetical protein